MALVKYFSKPTLYIMSKQNSNCKEIQDKLLSIQAITGRPELIEKVIYPKLKDFILQI